MQMNAFYENLNWNETFFKCLAEISQMKLFLTLLKLKLKSDLLFKKLLKHLKWTTKTYQCYEYDSKFLLIKFH